jgi:hypothetical protein
MKRQPRPVTSYSLVFLLLLVAGYLALLLSFAVVLPLRLGELLQAFASLEFSWQTFFAWIARTPDGVPGGFLAQLPFVLAAPHDRVLLRLVSVIGAIASCCVLFSFAKRIPIRAPLMVTIAFALLPAQLEMASQGRPAELALLLALLSATQFARLLLKPTLTKAAIYSCLLTCCLYTEPVSFLPAAGYVLFLVRFAGSKMQQTALAYLMPATVLPALLFLPYYTWASPQRSVDWLSEGPAADTFWIWMGLLLCALLLCGIAATMPPSDWPSNKRTILFCLAGGSLVTIMVCWLLDAQAKAAFDPTQVLAALPGLLLLSFAGLEWLFADRRLPATVLLLIVMGLSLPAVIEYANSPGPELSQLAYAIPRRMTNDSCLALVSMHEARSFFLFYEPQLAPRLCKNFFSKRVVLVAYPWVTQEQKQRAESLFQGLNFMPLERLQVAGGEIVVLETEKPAATQSRTSPGK